MWFDRRSRALLAALGLLMLLCAVAAILEARRGASRDAWPALTAGLGLGSRAGAGHGVFAWDAREGERRDGELGPLPGRAIDEPFAGGFELPARVTGAERR